MSKFKLRFLVHTITSLPDACGNRYHFARITSTRSGNSIAFECDGQTNAVHLLRRLGYQWDEMYSTEAEIVKRQWKEARRGITLYERDITIPVVLKLEGKKPVRKAAVYAALLREAFDYEPNEWATPGNNQPDKIDPYSLVDWFAEWRQRVKKAIGEA